jgi:hypothetical protein
MIAPEVKVLDDGILFKFIEDISNKSFDNKTEWGFVIKNKSEDLKTPRWAQALVIGPKVKYVEINDWILIENLQWTQALQYKDETFWKTSEQKVMIVSKERPTGYN